MGSTEQIERVTDLRAWPGEIPLSHLYTMGIAGERFFRELKDGGRFMGSRCAACEHVYLPPSLFCPRCFAALEEWKEVGPQGVVRGVTTAHLGVDGLQFSSLGQVAVQGAAAKLERQGLAFRAVRVIGPGQTYFTVCTHA